MHSAIRVRAVYTAHIKYRQHLCALFVENLLYLRSWCFSFLSLIKLSWLFRMLFLISGYERPCPFAWNRTTTKNKWPTVWIGSKSFAWIELLLHRFHRSIPIISAYIHVENTNLNVKCQCRCIRIHLVNGFSFVSNRNAKWTEYFMCPPYTKLFDRIIKFHGSIHETTVFRSCVQCMRKCVYRVFLASFSFICFIFFTFEIVSHMITWSIHYICIINSICLNDLSVFHLSFLIMMHKTLVQFYCWSLGAQRASISVDWAEMCLISIMLTCWFNGIRVLDIALHLHFHKG